MCLKGAPYKIYFYWLMKILLCSHVHISYIWTLFFFFNERSPESFSLIYKEPLFVTFPISLTSNKQVELKRELSSPIVMISFITSCGCSLTVTVLSMGGKIKKKKKIFSYRDVLSKRC